MLCNLADGAKADWKASVVKAVHAYNCMRSEARLLTVGAYKLLLTSSCFGETPDSLFRWFLVSQLKPKALPIKTILRSGRLALRMVTNWPQQQPIRKVDQGKFSMAAKHLVRSYTHSADYWSEISVRR